MQTALAAIFLGAFGVHKFMLGHNQAGMIMLAFCLLTGGLGSGIVGLIEGIIYLTKSDEDFYQTYVVERKAWF